MKEVQDMENQIDSDISQLKQYVGQHKQELEAEIRRQLNLSEDNTVDIFIGHNGLLNAYYTKEGTSHWTCYCAFNDKWS